MSIKEDKGSLNGNPPNGQSITGKSTNGVNPGERRRKTGEDGRWKIVGLKAAVLFHPLSHLRDTSKSDVNLGARSTRL